jgi:uncharacterized protein YndB with AHSA1/START domain
LDEDQIEREIIIAAPPAVVWDVITDPAKIALWWSASASFSPEEGAEGTLDFAPSHGGRRVAVRVSKAVRERYLAFRWDFPLGGQPVATNSTLVEFVLTPWPGGTHLRVVESGITRLDRDSSAKNDLRRTHAVGWAEHLSRLGTVAASLAAEHSA